MNDNKMSISRNVGSMARYLSHIRIKPFYLHTKSKMHRLEKIPLIGRPITNGMRNVKDWMRDEFFGQKNNLFEQLGFTYLGPYDGHNITELRAAFQAAQQKHFPVLIHVLTKKGKGYEYAEKNRFSNNLRVIKNNKKEQNYQNEEEVENDEDSDEEKMYDNINNY